MHFVLSFIKLYGLDINRGRGIGLSAGTVGILPQYS